MGGKRKILTQTRRAALKKEMTEALLAGSFTTNGRPVDEVLDEVNQGIVDGRYPIEVDLPTLIGIWTGTSAPTTQAPAPEQPAPTDHGTVDQIQAAVAQASGQPIPVNVHAGGMVNGQPAEQWQAQQAAQGYGPTAEQAAEYGMPASAPVVQQPSTLPAAVCVVPGQMVPTAFGQQTVQQVPQGAAPPMTFQQAQQAMHAAETMEVGEPPKPEPVAVDAGPVADWLGLARDAQAKIDKLKDILEAAKANASAYADQVGGPDRSKVLTLNGQIVMRRTFCVKNVMNNKRLAAEHPEIDLEVYKEPSSYYRTELV